MSDDSMRVQEAIAEATMSTTFEIVILRTSDHIGPNLPMMEEIYDVCATHLDGDRNVLQLVACKPREVKLHPRRTE